MRCVTINHNSRIINKTSSNICTASVMHNYRNGFKIYDTVNVIFSIKLFIIKVSSKLLISHVLYYITTYALVKNTQNGCIKKYKIDDFNFSFLSNL